MRVPASSGNSRDELGVKQRAALARIGLVVAETRPPNRMRCPSGEAR